MADYGYANTRVRAMKSYLFGTAFMEKLLSATDLSTFLALLHNTPYRGDIEKGMVKFSGILGVEEGLKIHLIRNFRKILHFCTQNKQAERLTQIVLGRFDVHNLKTVFRGIHSDAPKEEVMDQLVPAGQLDEAHLTELNKQGDIKSCIDLLIMWGVPYYIPLNESYADYLSTQNLANLELSIDRFYFQYAIQKSHGRTLNHRLVQEIVRREIDFTNIMTLLRLSRESIDKKEFDPARYFIPGGREITINDLVKLFELPEVEDIVEALKDTIYYPVLKEGLKHFYVRGALSGLERHLEEYSIKKSVALFKADPLSIAVITAFIWAKFNEVVNLRIIARGKEVGMPDREIKEALVLV